MSHLGHETTHPVPAGALTALLRQVAAAEPVEAFDPFQAGEVLGRFEIVRELGRGGLAVVYEARDRLLGRGVALKVLRAAGEAAPKDEPLLREAEAAARLSHPNIVTLLDVGQCDRGPYLVVELLHGSTLARSLARGPMDVGEALRIAREVAKGVAHAHARGVIHRDLSPANVFLCDDGQVKVLDLGMAHAFGLRKIAGGTQAYMAPEQWRGAPEDERTDVFALGAILYRMLSGELPFATPEELESPRAAPPLAVRGAPALGELVGRMLAKDPVQRPRDAEEVLVALTTCLVEVASTPEPERAASRARRRQGGRDAGARARRAPRNAIAVLPFVNMSPDPEQEYFSDGLSEEILNALAHVEGLRVTGRTSSFSFKRRSEDLRTIGEALGVGAVLEGTVRRAGSRVRMTVHLVRVADGYHIWSHRYDREITDIFAVQEEIASAVVDALRVKLLRRRAAARRPPTRNVDAYNQYLLGRYFHNRGTLDGYRLAVEAYESALRLDPTLAPAQAALGPAVMWLTNIASATLAEIIDGERRSVEAADRAVAMAPDLADGYAARGDVRTHVVWDWAGAQADFEQALALKPGDAGTRLRYAHLLAVLGRIGPAIEMAREAAKLDPLASDAWTYLGAYHSARGELGVARAALVRALEIAPDHLIAIEELALNHLLDGDPATALSIWERSGNPVRHLLGVALAQHDLGHAAESRRALDEMVERWSYSAAYQIAEIHAWRGERDLAFEWLERSRAQLDPGIRRMKYDPRLRALHDDARWAELLRTMKLPPD